MKKPVTLLLWVGIFAASMAFLESSVVVYLRALYYPEGFAFPLKMMDERILVTEIIRESATILMLFSISVIAVKGRISRFAVFIYSFAVWDIFYYIYLVLILGWPSSPFTWDLLFLIPATWVGPVSAPVINSLTMIWLGSYILFSEYNNEKFRLADVDWILLAAGSILIIAAYLQPYLSYISERYSISQVVSFNNNPDLKHYAMQFVPLKFSWLTFWLGQLLFFIAIFHMIAGRKGIRL